MGLKTLTIDFFEISNNPNMYSNYKFHYFNIEIKKIKYRSSKKISNYFNTFTGYAFKSNDYTKEGVKFIRIGDFNKYGDIFYNDMAILPEIFKENYKKYQLKKKDIVIALTGATIGKTALIENLEECILLNQRVGVIRASDKKINPKLLYYLTKLKYFKYQIQVDSMGKGQQNISPTDVNQIKLPFSQIYKQNEIFFKIEKFENNIKNLKTQSKKPKEIINDVFTREFGFNIMKFGEHKKLKKYYIPFATFSNNKDIRQSVKFHRKAGQFVVEELKSITIKKIKNFISEPIVLGKGISPSQYDENGDYYYVSMATIKNWKFEKEKACLVTSKYANANKNKTVQVNDIIIARSGEGTIGKVAIIEDSELNGVFADFTMRLRFQNYNPLFAYYYFRTKYFQYLIEINKKGLGNNTNIFPSQIQEFPLIDIPLNQQQNIVDEIKIELDKQEEIKKQIIIERNKIDSIIKNSLI